MFHLGMATANFNCLLDHDMSPTCCLELPVGKASSLYGSDLAKIDIMVAGTSPKR